MGATRYCDVCGGERRVVKTVPWQPNRCADCMTPLEDTEVEPAP
ncbi:hypothetical protein ACNS7O_01575 [Haloferacaceae archaeon DSL9]